MYDYHSKIARVNLSKGKVTCEELPDEMTKAWGTGKPTKSLGKSGRSIPRQPRPGQHRRWSTIPAGASLQSTSKVWSCWPETRAEGESTRLAMPQPTSERAT